MFNASDVTTAVALFSNMLGFGSAGTSHLVLDTAQALSMIVLFGAITQLMPNTQQILHHDWPTVDTKPITTAIEAGLLAWRPAIGTAFVSACILTVAITSIGSGTNFLYYKF
jgi:hypothetical protein